MSAILDADIVKIIRAVIEAHPRRCPQYMAEAIARALWEASAK